MTATTTTTRPLLEAKGIIKVLGSGAAEVKALKGVNLDLCRAS